MLPSVVHALAQIIGVFTVVIYGREGLDDNTEMSGERPSVVKFDERTFVPYGVSLHSNANFNENVNKTHIQLIC